MKTWQLEKAAAAHSKLKRALEYQDALAEYSVTGITVDRGEGGLSPARLEKGAYGTGTITSMGWPDELAEAMSFALQRYLSKQVADAKSELQSYGIEIE